MGAIDFLKYQWAISKASGVLLVHWSNLVAFIVLGVGYGVRDKWIRQAFDKDSVLSFLSSTQGVLTAIYLVMEILATSWSNPALKHLSNIEWSTLVHNIYSSNVDKSKSCGELSMCLGREADMMRYQMALLRIGMPIGSIIAPVVLLVMFTPVALPVMILALMFSACGAYCADKLQRQAGKWSRDGTKKLIRARSDVSQALNGLDDIQMLCSQSLVVDDFIRLSLGGLKKKCSSFFVQTKAKLLLAVLQLVPLHFGVVAFAYWRRDEQIDSATFFAVVPAYIVSLQQFQLLYNSLQMFTTLSGELGSVFANMKNQRITNMSSLHRQVRNQWCNRLVFPPTSNYRLTHLELRDTALHGKSEGEIIGNRVRYTLKLPAEVMVVGPSGGGKSSLLMALCGIAPHVGDIILHYCKIDEVESGKSHTFVYSGDEDEVTICSYVSQEPHFIDNVSVHTNLMFVESSSVDDVEYWADRLDIAHVLCRKPAELSGGERKAVAFIRTLLANRCRIICMDEVTTGMSVDLIARLRQVVTELVERDHITVLDVNHLQSQKNAGEELGNVVMLKVGVLDGIADVSAK